MSPLEQAFLLMLLPTEQAFLLFISPTEQAFLLMLSPPEKAFLLKTFPTKQAFLLKKAIPMISTYKKPVQLILKTLLYISQLQATVQLPESSLNLLQDHQTIQPHLLDGEQLILPGRRGVTLTVIVKNMCMIVK